MLALLYPESANGSCLEGHGGGALDRVSTAETNCASWRREGILQSG